MKLLLTLSLALGLLSWVTVACTPSEGPQKSKSVVGDLEPLELRPTAIVVQPKSEVSRRLETLSGDRVFVPSRFGETQISTAMTHWLAPGTLGDSFSLKVDHLRRRLFEFVYFATPDRESIYLTGWNLWMRPARPSVSRPTLTPIQQAPSRRPFILSETFCSAPSLSRT